MSQRDSSQNFQIYASILDLVLRRMLRISWTEKKSNKKVLKEAGVPGTANDDDDERNPSTATCFPESRHEKAWSGKFVGDR